MHKIFLMFLFLIMSSNDMCASWFSDLFRDVSVETKMPEITQDDDNVVVIMYVPDNIDPDNIRVEIKDKTLYVYGERKSKKEINEEGYYHKEVSSSSFNRMVSLPCLVDELTTSAEITDNNLIITMPKIKEEEFAAKKIKVFRSKKS